MEQKIIELVKDAVRDAVAPLYQQVREIQEKYYPNMNKPEDEAQTFDVSRFEKIYEKSGKLPKNPKSGANIY